jgi:hypothetical protein
MRIRANMAILECDRDRRTAFTQERCAKDSEACLDKHDVPSCCECACASWRHDWLLRKSDVVLLRLALFHATEGAVLDESGR